MNDNEDNTENEENEEYKFFMGTLFAVGVVIGSLMCFPAYFCI